MPPFTALLHCENDVRRLGRTLEMLLPCSEILIVDHGSADGTRRVALEYGARVIAANAVAGSYGKLARHNWIFCMQPGESINETLQTSLFEWSARAEADIASGCAFSVCVREQAGEDWITLPTPQTRLIPRTWSRWQGDIPAHEPSSTPLEGALLRFPFP